MNEAKYCAVAAGCVAVLFLLSGCNPEARGFALPLGNADAGKAAFVRLECTQCHSVAEGVDKDATGHPDIHFKLGGETTRVRTYGDLVTSIINPNHKISGFIKDANVDAEGNTNMPSHNEVMTVQELVDLTTYLQTTYKIIRPETHGMYYP